MSQQAMQQWYVSYVARSEKSKRTGNIHHTTSISVTLSVATDGIPTAYGRGSFISPQQ